MVAVIETFVEVSNNTQEKQNKNPNQKSLNSDASTHLNI